MTASLITRMGFELGYLALLTKQGLKPLSRWEKDQEPRAANWLQEAGLKTRWVSRSVQSGQRVRELIFSLSEEFLELYAARFNGQAIEHTPAVMRIEGRLFGYPSCCVESFIAEGYLPNALRRREQRLLFHWACPHCAVTPVLLPHYRHIYRQCRALMRGRAPSLLHELTETAVAFWLKRAAVSAASLVALGILPQTVMAQTNALDPHCLRLDLTQDGDQDLLSNDEETRLTMNPANPDENGNQVMDGVDLALSFSADIDALSTKPSATQPYLVHNMAFGLETCQVCGVQTNMGILEIVNPLENMHVFMPYMGKHVLEHGSFAYQGSVHSGRLNPAQLLIALRSTGGHFIPEPAGKDADNDGLRDYEEPVFQTNPADPDTDDDQIKDGPDVARELRAQVELLPRFLRPEDGPKDRPFVVEHPMDGFETCPRCGERVTMDIWDVINPQTGGFISIPSMALHYLTHGGFCWQGGQLHGGQGRVDPRQLKAALTGVGDGHQWPVPPDFDGDLLSDAEELDLGTSPDNPDENKNQVPDGVDRAKNLQAALDQLPTTPTNNQVYRLDFPLRGLERCAICATNVNMGHLTVCNPVAQLYVKLPYLALHYLEHGSCSFAGDVHGQGRLDVPLLQKTLGSTGPSHCLKVGGDTDADGLTDAEENFFQTSATTLDTDGDGVPDGFALAYQIQADIQALPRTVNGTCYVVEYPVKGLVTCPICGGRENMGSIRVINPRENLNVDVPYLALHFMRHGSFAYSAGAGQARVNPRLLSMVLHGDGAAHLVRLPNDTDGDGLLDNEEAAFGGRSDTWDVNSNGVADGVEVARRFYQQINRLPTQPTTGTPYLVHYEANCVMPCPLCGIDVNCGSVELIYPWAGIRTNLSYVQLHFLERGSLAVSAQERIDPLLLDTILQPGVLVRSAGNDATLRWKGKPGRHYQIYTAADLLGVWTPGPVFTGDGTELSFTDPAINPQRKFYKILAWD